MTRSRRALVGVIVLCTLVSCSSSSKTQVRADDASTAPLARPATTTSTTVTTAVPALSLEATTGTTATTAAPSTTTEPPVTEAPTTTAPPAGSFSISPTSGPGGGFVTAAGDGCVQNGSGAGLSFGVQLYNAAGALVTGDGGQVGADGTWSEPFSTGPVHSTGRFRIHAQCLDASYHVLFDYPDAYYDATG